MKTKRAFVTIAFVTAILAILLVGCEGEQGPQGPAGPNSIYIIGNVRTVGWFGSRETTGMVDIWVSGSNVIPTVEVNDIPIPFNIGSVPLRFSDWNFPIFAGEQVRLVVTYGDSDVATSTITMPDSFELTSPDTASDSLSLGDTLTLQWSISEAAEIYHLYFRSFLWYSDTLGGDTLYYYFDFYCDTLTTETQVSFLPNLLLPDSFQIYQFVGGSVVVELYAISGPVLAGDPGNITGDGNGIFNGYTYTREYYFQWQLPAPLSSAIKQTSEPIARSDKR